MGAPSDSVTQAPPDPARGRPAPTNGAASEAVKLRQEPAADRRPDAFLVVLLRALSAWCT
jgi:hypothetical protein